MFVGEFFFDEFFFVEFEDVFYCKVGVDGIYVVFEKYIYMVNFMSFGSFNDESSYGMLFVGNKMMVNYIRS